MSAVHDVPLLACAGPTGRATTLRIVSIVLRFLSLALFLGVGFVVTLIAPTGPMPALHVLVVLAALLLGFGLSLVRWLTLDRYVLRRTGRADVFADRVVLFKGDLVNEVEWKKVKRVVVKPHFTQIVRKGEIGGSALYAIPTRDPAESAQILAIFERHAAPSTGPTGAPDAAPPVAGTPAAGGRLLVAGGGDGWKTARGLISFALVVVYITALFRDSIRRNWYPWMPVVTTGTWEVDFLILLVTYQIARTALRRFMNARMGRAEFFPDSIKLYAGDAAAEVAWSDVAGFDDGSTDFVRLLRREPRRGEELAVPTPDEETRVAVLALLEERGVPRRDPRGMVG